MPIVYDETKDSLYLKGRVKEKDDLIKNMLKIGKYGISEIAQVASTTEEYVLKIMEELKRKK